AVGALAGGVVGFGAAVGAGAEVAAAGGLLAPPPQPTASSRTRPHRPFRVSKRGFIACPPGGQPASRRPAAGTGAGCCCTRGCPRGRAPSPSAPRPRRRSDGRRR